MKTNFRKWLYGLTMILSVAFIFPACSDDGKGGGEEDVPGELVGTWFYEVKRTVKMYYTFDAKGKFTERFSIYFEGWGEESTVTGTYEYDVKWEELILYYENSRQIYYEVKIKDNRLYMTHEDGTSFVFAKQ